MKFLKRFGGTDSLLTQTDKHAVEIILVEYPDIFARHRMDIGKNTEFTVRLTPKDDKALSNQNLAVPIHLKKTYLLNWPLCTNMGLSRSYLSQNTQVPFLRSENPMGNYVSLWISENSTPWLQMILITITTQSALCQTQHNTWQGNLSSAKLIALRLTIVCIWRTNGQRKCLLSILPAEPSPTRDLQKALADLCLPFQASCASI